MRISILGLGYVGTVCAVGLAADGHVVIGVDTNQAEVRVLAEGRSPVIEPGARPARGRSHSHVGIYR